MIGMQEVMYFITMAGAAVSIIIGIMKHKKLAIQISGSFLVMTGIIVILGYIIGVPAIFTFPKDGIGMALPTAICFLVSGISFILLANEIKFKEK